MTVYDPSIIEKNIFYLPEVSVVYLASLLFDCLFSLSLVALESPSSTDVPVTPNVLARYLKQLSVSSAPYQPKVHQAYGESIDNTAILDDLHKRAALSESELHALVQSNLFNLSSVSSQSVSNLSAVADRIGHIHSSLQLTSPLQSSIWPGLSEVGALLLSLNVEGDLSLPYSWRAAEAFQSIVETLCDPSAVKQRNANYRRADDKMILSALDAAFTTLTLVTGLSHEQLLSLNQKAMDSIVTRIKKTPKKFRRPSLQKAGEEYQTMTPAGHLEKVIAVDELEEEDAQKALKASTAGGSADVSRNLLEEDEKKGKNKTLRSRVLRSDVMLDFVEKLLAK